MSIYSVYKINIEKASNHPKCFYYLYTSLSTYNTLSFYSKNRNSGNALKYMRGKA